MKLAVGPHWLAPALALAATLAAGPAPAADDVHPFDTFKRNAAAHQILQDIEEDSFGKAVADYPTADGSYTVDLGGYMMWRIIGLFESDDRVEGLRLAAYDQQCRKVQAVAADSVVCAYASELVVRAGGREYRSRYTAETDVGRYMAPTARSFAEVVRAELREQVDSAVAQFKRDMAAAGILPVERGDLSPVRPGRRSAG